MHLNQRNPEENSPKTTVLTEIPRQGNYHIFYATLMLKPGICYFRVGSVTLSCRVRIIPENNYLKPSRIVKLSVILYSIMEQLLNKRTDQDFNS
jgi:hypothetical protein